MNFSKKDKLLDEFAIATLKDEYGSVGTSPQEAFARAAEAFADADEAHAQDYMTM